MVRQDILGGLKNAVERGYPLEAAKQSFINAGYNAHEVEEAALNLQHQGILPNQPVFQQPIPQLRPVAQTQPQTQSSTIPQTKPQVFQTQQSSAVQQKKPNGKKKWWLWIIVAVLFVLVIVGGAYLAYLFQWF